MAIAGTTVVPNNELIAQNIKSIETLKLNKYTYRDTELRRLGRSSRFARFGIPGLDTAS
jgi:hypothetical protein